VLPISNNKRKASLGNTNTFRQIQHGDALSCRNRHQSCQVGSPRCGPGSLRVAHHGLPHQGRRVQYQGNFATAENGRSADALDGAENLAQWLDDGLELPKERIDHEPGPPSGVFDDDNALT
jgi:hypothetical protein